MATIIDHLMGTPVCPDQLHPLALTFHLKILPTATYAREPTPLIRHCYRFLVNYYR